MCRQVCITLLYVCIAQSVERSPHTRPYFSFYSQVWDTRCVIRLTKPPRGAQARPGDQVCRHRRRPQGAGAVGSAMVIRRPPALAMLAWAQAVPPPPPPLSMPSPTPPCRPCRCHRLRCLQLGGVPPDGGSRGCRQERGGQVQAGRGAGAGSTQAEEEVACAVQPLPFPLLAARAQRLRQLPYSGLRPAA